MNHQLKIESKYIHRIASGEKTFELRKNDRDYQKGDTLFLQEWEEHSKRFVGDTLYVEVTYVLHGPLYGLAEGYCIMGIKRVK